MGGISSNILKPGTPENKKKFNGIELNTDLDLNQYDAFFRNLDPQIGTWRQIDPKPGDMISPYAAMDNNPVLYDDFLGDIIDPDENTIERYQKLVKRNNDEISKSMNDIINTIESGGNITTKNFEKKIWELNKNLDFRDILTELKESDITYHISSANPGGGNLGVTKFNKKTNQIDIRIGNSDISTLAHELRHAYGFEKGELAFDKSGNPILSDNVDELKGEEFGYFFGTPGERDFAFSGGITIDHMHQRGYTQFTDNDINLNTISALIKSSPFLFYPNLTAKEVMQKQNNEIVANGGQIQFIYNDVLRVKNKK